jgi:hypothetical protein
MWQPYPSQARFTSRRSRTTRSRRARLECVQDCQLLSAAEFELISLVTANGGDGSTGFVVSGISDHGKLEGQAGYQL